LTELIENDNFIETPKQKVRHESRWINRNLTSPDIRYSSSLSIEAIYGRFQVSSPVVEDPVLELLDAVDLGAPISC
jgi:hypothetical protein